MPNKMLIDATHPEETRVVVVRGNRVEEFDFESAQRKQLRGNIYLAKVTRVEPSLQAAFIEYGGNRHGFLAFSEIHPDYYQIPVADRQALIEADERAHREAEEENEHRSSRRRSRHRNSRRRSSGERVQSEVIEIADGEQPAQIADQAAVAGEGGEAPLNTSGDAEHFAAGADHADEHHQVASDQPYIAEVDHAATGESHFEAPHPFDAPALNATAAPVFEAQPEAAPALTSYEPAAHAEAAPSEDAAPTDHADVVASHDDQTAHHDEAEHHDDAPHADIHHDDDVHHDDADHDDDDDGDDDAEEEVVESVGGDDALEEMPERTFRPRRQYKIQEVIKRRQVMLVQVVKEERGNKGAALTTYLSLAGRYAVLMPNTARGGGISRKITSAQDRSRLKEVVQDLDVPEGMGIILRTAGAARTKPEIKRDFEYLIRMWETVRDTTLRSQAPTLVYEEGSLIKRSLRDLFNKEIDEIQVAGEAGYREARDFMKMLMPSSVRAVKPYRDGQPLFSRMGVESQLDVMFTPIVQLRSGGYLVINQTEALVSIDVNSGRSTREHHIEDTALKTNLEAAEEVARQLRLRDLAGLIVIDFIDMDERRNNRAVERKLSDCLRQDRARIQVGRISHFGLLEMSRQRIRASVLESSTEPCPHCGGSGHIRSVSSVALQVLRNLEEILMKGATHNLTVRTRNDVALYVLNHKRAHLRDLETSFKVTLSVLADPTLGGQQAFVIDRGEQVHTLEAAKALLAAQAAAAPAIIDDTFDDDDAFDIEAEVETEETEGLTDEQSSGEGSDASESESSGDGQRRRRRRRRRGRDSRDHEIAQNDNEAVVSVIDIDDAAQVAEMVGDRGEDTDGDREAGSQDEQGEGGERRPRRRGRRGGRRRRGGGEEGLAASIADELAPPSAPEVTEAVADFDGDTPADAASPAHHANDAEADQPTPVVVEASKPIEAIAPVQEPVASESATDAEKSVRRRSTVREKVSFASSEAAAAPAAAEVPQAAPIAVEPVAPSAPAPEPVAETPSAPAPRRAGWWSRRFGGGN
ncbi:MAG: Rne/Rng family ribonuclease [Rhizobiales bacterium]|nr:Rne/Rng family ribonuclease [Hyphomicrobiales bacterium]